MSNVDAGCLKRNLIKLLKDLNLWKENLENEIPKKWEKYDDFILFTEPCFMDENWFLSGSEIWEHICRLLKGQRIAIKGVICSNEFRSPQVRIIHGESSIVSCTDNRIKYTWDIKRNMFCAGNVTERHRIGQLDCKGEVVVDLFAGIGYFVLPYLIHANADFVHACEWNPDAVIALRRNLEINKVINKCEIHEGDCREVCPEGVANRVNLGLIPRSEVGWVPACKALVSDGGILYVHQNVTSGMAESATNCPICNTLFQSLCLKIETTVTIPPIEVSMTNNDISCKLSGLPNVFWKKYEWFVFSLHVSHVVTGILKNIHSNPWIVSANDVHKIKSYAPHVDHLVITLNCYPLQKG